MSKKKTTQKEPNKAHSQAPSQEPDNAKDNAELEANVEAKDKIEAVAEPEASNDDAEFVQLQEECNKQAEEIAKLKDAFLRAKAEEDNVRRRAEKDVANSRKFAVEGFAKELLSVRDSLSLAATVELDQSESDSVKSMKEGVDITLKQLDSALAKFAVKEIAANPGDQLDPHLHQAMSMIESADVESGCIVNVIQTGFTLHERLLRPCLVVVAQ